MNPTDPVELNTFNRQPLEDTVTITIDNHEALRLLEQAVEERGSDYKYDYDTAAEYRKAAGFPAFSGPSCFYWHGDKGVGCIAGLALSKAGVTGEVLDAMDRAVLNNQASGTSIANLRNFLSLHGVNLTSSGAGVLRAAQMAQDDGCDWGAALSQARNRSADFDAGIV